MAALRANQERGTTNSQVEDVTGMEENHIAALKAENEHFHEPRNNDTMHSSIPRDQQAYAREQIAPIAEVVTPI